MINFDFTSFVSVSSFASVTVLSNWAPTKNAPFSSPSCAEFD